MKTGTHAPRITRADIRIGFGLWHGDRFRAAYVVGTDHNLTGPAHATLPEAALLRVALAEATRAGILAPSSVAARMLGQLGRQANTAAQRAASQRNGHKGGRPRLRARCPACITAGRRCRHVATGTP